MGYKFYFALDESNHAGQNKKGEIVTCIASTIHKDSIVRKQSNRRDYGKVLKLLEDPERDFRFTILF